MFYSQPSYSSGMKVITKKTHKYARNQGISYKSFLRNLPEDKLHPTKR